MNTHQEQIAFANDMQVQVDHHGALLEKLAKAQETSPLEVPAILVELKELHCTMIRTHDDFVKNDKGLGK